MNAAGHLLFAGADEAVALECGAARIGYGELQRRKLKDQVLAA